ncbi:exodeoxyribonuclease VII large subunit [Pseudomonas viridiflava]|uniref:exodeoxyribonuclease VII large subunit n=1 Tax=Pseudomonas viridiflava TaxID=33069 RepID=UPI0018E65FF0|nr:exodeoxyribonuclease VII large subunit [Pseudomonas viridiflava]MBI6727059.1 exodeoxyribonuclease VII large subunit [Pseudomonas viridiflava]
MKLKDHLPLNVPMAEKDAAKRAGVRPHYDNGKFIHWFAPAGSDVMLFRQWWTREFQQLMVQEGVIEAPAVEKPPAHGESLSAILMKVKRVVNSSFTDPIWIRAEIVNITGGNHVYLELSDYDQAGNENAKARGMIWASDRDIINQFREISGLDLKAGLKILFKGNVEFSEKFGLGIRIAAIDPAFTLGDMEAKLAGIKKKLVDNKLYDKNKSLRKPFDFFNVAVVSPKEAAGLADFKTQANLLVANGLCKFTYYDAVFSGKDCTKSVVAALNAARQADDTIDCLVIIRGGGDKAGLYALNEYEIAAQVCDFPVPVIVGIGHEPDNTILDEVACVRCPTPSLAIAHICNTIFKNAQEAKRNMLQTTRMASEVVARARQRAEGTFSEIKDKARQTVERARSSCEISHSSVMNAATNYLDRSRSHVKGLIEQVYLNNPLNVLNKGYAIVREADGKVITSREDIQNKTITIQLKDGTVGAVTGELMNFNKGK